MKIAQGRIRDEKRLIDLYIWINRYEERALWRADGLPLPPHAERGPFFVFATDAGYALARASFNVPATPQPESDPGADVPTLGELLRREALRR